MKKNKRSIKSRYIIITIIFSVLAFILGISIGKSVVLDKPPRIVYDFSQDLEMMEIYANMRGLTLKKQETTNAEQEKINKFLKEYPRYKKYFNESKTQKNN